MTNDEIIAGRLLPVQDLPLYRLAEEYCWRWASLNELDLRMVEPLRNHGSRAAFGWFDRGSKRINIGIRFSKHGVWFADALKAFQILDTISHELAHLRQFNHGKRHKEFTREIFMDMDIENSCSEIEKLRHHLSRHERYA